MAGVFRHCEEAHADAVCAIEEEAIDGACATAEALETGITSGKTEW